MLTTLRRVAQQPDATATSFSAVQRLAGEAAEIDAALDRARRQLGTIDAKLRDVRADGPDGERAAAALLAGEPVTADDADLARLELEREAVRSGIAALNRRKIEVDQARGQAEAELRTALGGSVDDIAMIVRARAASALADLAQAFADAEALHAATRNLRALELTTHLRGPLFRLAVEQICERTALRPSADVVAALPAAELIRAAGGHVPATVAWPAHP